MWMLEDDALSDALEKRFDKHWHQRAEQ